MNETIKSILRILEEGTPELQIAAAQVLGELRPQDRAVATAVGKRLVFGETHLTRYLLQTLAAIGSSTAVGQLVQRLDDPSHADLVAHLLGEIGAAAVTPIAAAFEDAEPEVRVRILGILGRHTSTAAVKVLERALVDPALTAEAAQRLLDIPADSWNDRERKGITERLTKAIGKGEGIEPECLGNALRVLGAIDGKASRALLVKFTTPEHELTVRHAALEALADVKLTPTQAASMLDYVEEGDLDRVVTPTMRLLDEVDKWTPAAATRLRKMVSSRRPHLRLFALRVARHLNSPDLVKPLLNHLFGSDTALADAASTALAAYPSALDPLLRTFQNDKRVERVRLVCEPLAELAKAKPFKPAQLKAIAEKGCKNLIAQESTGEVQLGLLTEVAPEAGVKTLVDKALRLRRARKFGEALAILMFLAQADRLDDEGQYQLAVVRLLLDAQERRSAQDQVRVGDATMGYFAVLVRDGFPVLPRLKKETMTKPEDLLRIGAHFAEGVGAERRFGAELLHHVADKHGNGRAGEEARIALRAEGL